MEPNFEHAVLIFKLLIIFQIKHYLADYLLQTEYMLGKFKAKDWEMPLLTHAGVHGLMTCAIVWYFVGWQLAIFMAVLDVIVHFTVDRVKASPFMFGRYQPHEKMYWIAHGADQFMHHITHYIIIFTVLYHTYL